MHEQKLQFILLYSLVVETIITNVYKLLSLPLKKCQAVENNQNNLLKRQFLR